MLLTVTFWLIKKINYEKKPHVFNPFTHMSDQDNISLQYLYNIKQMSEKNREK